MSVYLSIVRASNPPLPAPTKAPASAVCGLCKLGQHGKCSGSSATFVCRCSTCKQKGASK